VKPKTISVTLKVWRQKDMASKGWFKTFEVNDVDVNMSLLEVLDLVNLELERQGKEPIAFDHDCREGICGSCGAMVNGHAHGPGRGISLCQLRMRHFEDGETVVVEPWRMQRFPVLKDLVVNRSAYDRIIAAGGYVAVRTGAAPEAHAIPVPRGAAEAAFAAAQCIGCGACAAVCPNGSAMLFVSAKIAHLDSLPQGQIDAEERARRMLAQMRLEGFGDCTENLVCQAACPKSIGVDHIAYVKREYMARDGR
jgi:succinate dehydrogenase / fumarate reductase iron-sulfur subunit